MAKRYNDAELILYDHRPKLGSEDVAQIIKTPKSWSRSWSLDRELQRDKVDVYHGLSNELPLRSTSSLVKKVVTIHDLLYMDFPNDYPWIDRQIYNFKFKRSAHLADKIIAISKVTKNDLIDRFSIPAEKIEIIYQSCAPRFFEKNSNTSNQKILEDLKIDQPFILCVGSFSFRKNQEQLIKAFSGTKFQAEVELIFVGGENKLSRRLAQTQSRHSFRMLHGISTEKLTALYQSSLFTVYPSLKEGFGIPVLESLASGKTSIVAQDTSCHEAGGGAVLTFDPNRTDSLVHAIHSLVDDVSLRVELEGCAMKQLDRLSPEKQIPKLIELYQSLV